MRRKTELIYGARQSGKTTTLHRQFMNSDSPAAVIVPTVRHVRYWKSTYGIEDVYTITHALAIPDRSHVFIDDAAEIGENLLEHVIQRYNTTLAVTPFIVKPIHKLWHTLLTAPYVDKLYLPLQPPIARMDLNPYAYMTSVLGQWIIQPHD